MIYAFSYHHAIQALQSNRMLMNFVSLHELAAAVDHHQLFQHEIKGKRIKKELANLEDYRNQRVTFKNFEISQSGISFYVQVQYDYRLFDFEVLVDLEYPFSGPQVYYQHESSPFAHCQDLLETVLEGNKWGPSMLLSATFQKLPVLARLLFEDSESLRAGYILNNFYEEALLSKYKVELFTIDEYEWKYMIKSTSTRVIALSKEHLLKFTQEDGKLKLTYFVKIKDIKEANATINNGRFKLDISIVNQTGKLKLYFGGEQADIQKILYFMNPIQATERKLSKLQKKDYKGEELQEVIQKYSELIEYYSLRDQQRTKGYVSTVQQLIRKSFEVGMKEQQLEQKMEKQKEDIKT